MKNQVLNNVRVPTVPEFELGKQSVVAPMKIKRLGRRVGRSFFSLDGFFLVACLGGCVYVISRLMEILFSANH